MGKGDLAKLSYHNRKGGEFALFFLPVPTEALNPQWGPFWLGQRTEQQDLCHTDLGGSTNGFLHLPRPNREGLAHLFNYAQRQ